jgi:hypothetical protein
MNRSFILLTSLFSYGDCSPWTAMALDEVRSAREIERETRIHSVRIEKEKG